MRSSIYDKVLAALHLATQHNINTMVKPEVILWPDPELQWAPVIPELQEKLPALLTYGAFDDTKKQGPAIWLKCMIAQTLPGSDWDSSETPIIYLPGVSKNDLKNVQNAGLDFQPLLEYQYTGTIFTQENGREWTILAFLQNSSVGLGVKVAQDYSTREALKKSLPSIFQDRDVLHNRAIIDADYLNNHQFPDIIPMILKWISKGDGVLKSMSRAKQETFISLCKTQYEFEPDEKNIKTIVEKLGSQRNAWKYVWQHFANAPKKYPELEELLRLAKPADLGTGMFAFPEESWPQVNEARELELAIALEAAAALSPKQAVSKLKMLDQEHAVRRNWVWSEMGKAPLSNALQHLAEMGEGAITPFPFGSIDEMQQYYITEGYKVDQSMRMSLNAVRTEKDKIAVQALITTIYKPWLESITIKFQTQVEQNPEIFTSQNVFHEDETFILFVDAFRFELAEDFSRRLKQVKYKVMLNHGWSAIPSVTPTAKPNISPITNAINSASSNNEFRPQLKSGKDLQIQAFRDALLAEGFICNATSTDATKKYWFEIGDIDTKGHNEQAEIVRRVDELFDQVAEKIEMVFSKGAKRIKIVTDHGWLLLPGGLPKTELKKELTETRWGRCAHIKEGARTNLLHLPWRWNPGTFIAYAPGISFFRRNEEYAHGGISIHECLVPVLIVEKESNRDTFGEIKVVKWINLKCTVETDDVPDGFSIDIRTKFNDPKTSVILSVNRKLHNNSVTLMVDDSAEHSAATIVLLDESDRIIDKKPTTVGG